MAHEMIAIIDDDIVYMDMMCDLLQEEGYRVQCFTTAREALPSIQHHRPALVILDLYMEQRDSGLTVLQMLRLHPATATIPVIVCSADGQFLRQKQEQLQNLHCDTLEKPFDLDELLEKIRANIRLAR